MPPRIGRRLAVSSAHLAAASLWLEGHEPTDDLRDAAAELEAAGLARDGHVAPRLGELLEVMLRPHVKLSLEVQTPTSTELDLVWLRPELAVAAEVAGDVMTLEPIDPLLVPTDLARRLGVRNGPPAAPTGPLDIDTGLLDRLEERARTSTAPELRGWLAEQGIDDEVWGEALVAAVRDRRATWRVGSGWVADEQVETRSLTILDGGRGGAYEVVPDDAGASPRATLHPRSARDVLDRLRSCLP